MFTVLFWRFAFERAVKTFAQTMLALLSVGGIGLLDAPWAAALSVSGMAALLSVLMSVASAQVGERNTPSLVPPAAPAGTPVPPAAPAESSNASVVV